MKNRIVWTQQEDQILKYLIEKKSIKAWNLLADIMIKDYKISKRSGKQCRQRWDNNLRSSFSKQQWSKQEVMTLFNLQRELGCKWTKISKIMSNRSANGLKNHYYSLLRKEYRKINRYATLKKLDILEFVELTKILTICEVNTPNKTISSQQILQCLKLKQFLISNIDVSLQDMLNFSQQNMANTIKSIHKYAKKYQNFILGASKIPDYQTNQVDQSDIVQLKKIKQQNTNFLEIQQIEKQSTNNSLQKYWFQRKDLDALQYFNITPPIQQYTLLDFNNIECQEINL